MMAWMNAESLRMTLDEGRMVYWSRSRQELWRKGDTSGDRQYVREAYYDCDGDVLLFQVEQEGQGACHTGARTCFFRRFGVVNGCRCSRRRDEFHALAAEHTRRARVDRAARPTSRHRSRRSPKLVGDGAGFLLESVEHGERWSRFSFVGRDPSATLTLRDGVLDDRRRAAAPAPDRPGHPRRARGAAAASTERRSFPDLPPLHGGVMGYLGYDVIREVERLPDVPHDDRGLPDAVMSVIGSLAAFDHWRQRVYLIESVPAHGLSADAARRRVRRRRGVGRAGGRRPRPAAAVRAGRAAPRRATRCPTCASSMPGGLYQQAVEVAKEYILAGDIFQVVLAQRYDLDARRRPVRRLPRAAPGEPEPVHVLPAPPRHHHRRLLARADGAGARRAR